MISGLARGPVRDLNVNPEAYYFKEPGTRLWEKAAFNAVPGPITIYHESWEGTGPEGGGLLYIPCAYWSHCPIGAVTGIPS